MSVEMIVRRNDLPAVTARIDKAADRRLGMVRQRVAMVAKSRAAVDTGEMRDGVQVTTNGVTASADHSVHVEYGTWKMAAQPFMRPAAAVGAAFCQTAFVGFEGDLL